MKILFTFIMLISFSSLASNKGYQTQTVVEKDCLKKAHKAAITDKIETMGSSESLLTFVKYNSELTTVYVEGSGRAKVKKSGKIVRIKYTRSCKISKSLALYTKYQLKKFSRLGSIHE